MFQMGRFGFVLECGPAWKRLQPGWTGGGSVESISYPVLFSGTALIHCRTCVNVRRVSAALRSGKLFCVSILCSVMGSTDVK